MKCYKKKKKPKEKKGRKKMWHALEKTFNNLLVEIWIHLIFWPKESSKRVKEEGKRRRDAIIAILVTIRGPLILRILV